MRALKVLSYREEAGVATVTLGPPIDTALITELEAICEHIEDASPCDVVVFEGAGPHFSGEIDLRAFNPGKPLDIHGFHRWERVLTTIERLDRVTIAALRGKCVGAGFHIALACDLRLAAADVRVGLDEVRKGFLPGMSTFRLAKYVGLGRAKQLTLTGRQLEATEAERWGLIDRVAAPEAMADALDQLVEDLQPINRIAVQLNRRLLNESYAIQYEEFVGNFLAAQHRAITSDAFRELLEAAHRGA